MAIVWLLKSTLLLQYVRFNIRTIFLILFYIELPIQHL